MEAYHTQMIAGFENIFQILKSKNASSMLTILTSTVWCSSQLRRLPRWQRIAVDPCVTKPIIFASCTTLPPVSVPFPSPASVAPPARETTPLVLINSVAPSPASAAPPALETTPLVPINSVAPHHHLSLRQCLSYHTTLCHCPSCALAPVPIAATSRSRVVFPSV